ncbi:Sec-independent protein translocase subunit TatA [uncultured Acinetobacter sp.]|uniref:Sec-independent protein translocase subunit TatA n=1 Tax=uncultured Acinetobacter sp. TaxID=165433 RepID=UPI00258E297E|nr:Sec-independent protein translocase subunit TatA [uncultured Acinetobacter sp.]
MAGLSIWHVIIFLVVVVLLFGTSKLKNLGKDVGGAVKDFKKSMRDETEENAQLHIPRTIDAEVKTAERSSAKS